MNGSASPVRIAAAVAMCAIASFGTLRGTPPTPSADDRAIVHTLNRLAFGARPGDVERVRHMGLRRWIDQQLEPQRIANASLEARLARLTMLDRPVETLAADFAAVRRERVRRQRENAAGADEPAGTASGRADRRRQPGPNMPAEMRDAVRRERQAFTDLAEAKILRAVYSERQLEEVLVDFWFNHFNVFARKGQTEIYISAYERDAIRPHVFGSFRELLGATARSPAMLVYLDNWLSADPEATARFASARTRVRAMPGGGRVRGLNENYARELLELHTLGVDGGYTQTDVVEVARAFTGWTVGRPDDPGFRLVAPMHDRRAKTVLGHTIAAGGGIDDGEKVLDVLAGHPSTARHVATKLAQRFVSDTPPTSIIDKAARTFALTSGNLREVVRTIVTSDEFLADSAYRSKVKTPFEFVVSALRATDADVQGALPAVRAIGALGMPLYLCQPPTGYDETSEPWISSGALVARMNFAVALAHNQLRGISLGVAAGETTTVHDRILGDVMVGDVSASTLDTIRKATTGAQAAALAIGAPEFQKQ